MENNYYDDEDVVVILPPYYRVTYIDDEGRTHMATIKDLPYLHFIKDRFIVTECVLVTE